MNWIAISTSETLKGCPVKDFPTKDFLAKGCPLKNYQWKDSTLKDFTANGRIVQGRCGVLIALTCG